MDAEKQRECVGAIHKMGGVVTYDKALHNPPFPKWLWKHLGIDAFSHVIAVGFDLRVENGVTDPAVIDTSLKCVASLYKLESLDLSNTDVTDAGLFYLGDLSSLRILILSNTDITNDGLKHLANLSSLEVLDLEGTAVSLEGVSRLQSNLEACEINISVPNDPPIPENPKAPTDTPAPPNINEHADKHCAAPWRRDQSSDVQWTCCLCQNVVGRVWRSPPA